MLLAHTLCFAVHYLRALPRCLCHPSAQLMIVFGGVSPAEDLNDVAVWLCTGEGPTA